MSVRNAVRYLVSENDIISTLIPILKTYLLSSPFSLYSMTKFPTALKPAARSAYREVLRAARITFQGTSPLALFFSLTHVHLFSGDPSRHHALLTALRATFSSPTLTPPPSASSPPVIPISEESIGVDEVAKRITEWKELARFLKRNVVQGVKGDDGAWSEYPTNCYVDKAKDIVRTSSNGAHRTG